MSFETVTPTHSLLPLPRPLEHLIHNIHDHNKCNNHMKGFKKQEEWNQKQKEGGGGGGGGRELCHRLLHIVIL